MVRDLAALAGDHQGAVAQLAEMARALSVCIELPVDAEFQVVFPEANSVKNTVCFVRAFVFTDRFEYFYAQNRVAHRVKAQQNNSFTERNSVPAQTGRGTCRHSNYPAGQRRVRFYQTHYLIGLSFTFNGYLQ